MKTLSAHEKVSERLRLDRAIEYGLQIPDLMYKVMCHSLSEEASDQSQMYNVSVSVKGFDRDHHGIHYIYLNSSHEWITLYDAGNITDVRLANIVAIYT